MQKDEAQTKKENIMKLEAEARKGKKGKGE
ncbi:hypothetical protein RDI58_024282 [Solanum bulbocastanum]|uniref:Uncharacterized protein n=1 Tax=Solanum bulbocastanum TaxID=147425 RepID=A0AAN8Y362_SOLBU